jgi:hypothetical protein
MSNHDSAPSFIHLRANDACAVLGVSRSPYAVRSLSPSTSTAFLAIVFFFGASGGRQVAAQAPSELSQAPSEPAPAPVAKVVQPPIPTNQSPVAYPAQAIGEKYFVATPVVLVLDIDAGGAVTAVEVEGEPGHGFAEEARTAAQALRFRPATRAGIAISSRIKYRYQFVPPPARLVGRILRRASDGPLDGAVVVITLGDGSTRETRTDARGDYLFEGLAPGPVRLRASAPSVQAVTAAEVLSYAEETRLILRAEDEPATTGKGMSGVTAVAGADIAEEVNVRGTKPPREVVKRTLGREEIAKIPGTNGDALRSVESLPGVSRPPPFRGELIVRGSAAEDTSVLIDGTPVPLVYHFGGLSSVVPTESIERLDFYPGNFSSVFGRGMGGVVDVGLRDPKADQVHALAQLDFIDLRLMVEGPIAKTGWKFLVAGRRSWFDLWLGPILAATSSGPTSTPRYYDYQMMVQKDFSRSSSFRATLFGSDDAFKISQSGTSSASTGGSLGIATNFWRAQAVYRNQLSDNAELKATAAGGTDTVNIGVGSEYVSTVEHPLSLRSELSYKFGTKVRANVGVDALYIPYDLTLRLPEQTGNGSQPNVPGARLVTATSAGTRIFGGVYTEWEIAPWRGARVVPGFRADSTSTTSQVDLSPRLNLRQQLFSGPHAFALKGAVGLFFQPPTAAESDAVYGQRNLRSKRAVHYDIGAEQQFTPAIRLTVDGYYKQMDRLVIAGHGNAGEGRAYGLETLLRYEGDGRLFGWIAYTLSRSERRDSSTVPWYPFEYDQTHILTILGSYQIGRGWRVGSRFRYVTGNTYSPTTTGAFDSTVGSTLGAVSAAQNSGRLPDFQQLDLRVDKVWAFKSWKFSMYLDVQNAYNRRADEGVSYNYDYTESAYTKGLTILPSLGFRGEF